MAKEIKTKEKVIEKKSKGSVGKVADRVKIISIKAKDGVVEAKDKIQEKSDMTDERSPEQYATEDITEGIHKAVENAGIVADKAVKIGTRKIKEKVKQKKADKAEIFDNDVPDNMSDKEYESDKKRANNKEHASDKQDKKNDVKSKSDKSQSDGKIQSDAQSKPHTEIDKADRQSGS